MCKSKKILAVILAATTLASTAPTTVMAAPDVTDPIEVVVEEEVVEEPEEEVDETPVIHNSGYDSTAPVVTSISTDKSSYEVGETVTYTMNITEEGTGIGSVRMMIQSTVSGKYYSFNPSGIGNGNALTGTYTASFEVTDYFTPGNWRLVLLTTKDIAGNEALNDYYLYESFVDFTVGGDAGDTTAPIFDGVSVNSESINAGQNNIAIVECHDEDLASIRFLYQSTETSRRTTREATLDIDGNISSSGLYYVVFPSLESDIAGQWYICQMYLTDTAGNTSDNYCTCYYNVVNENDESDNEKPVITNVTASTETVVLPGLATITVSGTENVDGWVDIAVRLVNRDTTTIQKFVDFSAEVINGEFSATSNISFDSSTTPGTWVVDWVKVTDETGNWIDTLEYDNVTYTLVNDTESIYGEATLSNTNLHKIIGEMGNDDTLLVNADVDIIPANVFRALKGTNKTIIVDQDGIQWIINGSDITNENIKDIDISVSIQNANTLTYYGYTEDAQGVVLTFASNGMLPGTTKVRIKSDYITDKFGIDSSLFLACIKGTMEVEEEYINYIYQYPEDEDGNPIYYTVEYEYDEDGNIKYAREYLYDWEGNPILDEDGEPYFYEYPLGTYTWIEPEIIEEICKINYIKDTLVQIEDAGVSVSEDGYVTLTMTHNSSYILSNKLPSTNGNNNDRYFEVEDNVIEDVVVVPPTFGLDISPAPSNDVVVNNNDPAKNEVLIKNDTPAASKNEVVIKNETPKTETPSVVTPIVVAKANDETTKVETKSNDTTEEVKTDDTVKDIVEDKEESVEAKNSETLVDVQSNDNNSISEFDSFVEEPIYVASNNTITESTPVTSNDVVTIEEVVEVKSTPIATFTSSVAVAFTNVKKAVATAISSIFTFFANLF